MNYKKAPSFALAPPSAWLSGIACILFLAFTPAQAQITLPASQLDSTRAISYERDANTGYVTAETVEPASAQHCKRTEYLYDTLGNKTKTTIKNCTAPAATGSALFTARASIEAYDANGDNPAGLYPNRLENAAGHIQYARHHNAFGQPVISRDSKYLATNTSYDSFGRKTQEIYPDNNKTLYAYQYCDTAGLATPSAGQTIRSGCPTGAVWMTVQTPQTAAGVQNAPQKLTFLDAQSRVIATQVQQFATLGAAPKWVTVYTDYDALGRVARSSEPHFSGDAIAWTTFTYDDLGRVTQQDKPSPFAAGGIARHKTDYNGREITATNPLGATQKRERDEYDRIIRITDTQGNQHSYQFDAWGNLHQTKDALGYTTTIWYDTSGHKASMADPDMGTWNYWHDSLGQLRSQTGPKALTTNLQYDTLGRMTSRSEPEMVSTWAFDKTAANAACGVVTSTNFNSSTGELCEAKTSTGYRRLNTFDNLGRISQSSTVLASSATTPAFVSKISYDSNSRISQQTWPTGLAASHTYDSLGFLTNMALTPGNQALWQRQENNARGQFVKVSYGNGIQTRNTYEPQTGLITASQAGPATNAQDASVANHSYNYNALGHLTLRTDTNHAISESFLYDSLNRLSNQILTNTASAAVVRQTRYRYNAIGNILANSEVGNYSYASGRPHALTSLYGSAGKLSQPQYSYDLHGNIQSVSGTSVTGPTSSSPVNRTHTWTSFDNPLSFKLSEGAVQTDFLYGPEHQRIRETFSKTVAGVTTAKTLHILHPDNAGALYFEREAKTVGSATSTINTLENRHYLAAETGSFLLITTNGAIQTNPTATSLTALSSPGGPGSSSETRYWHKDHLGSIVASTKQSSATSTTGAALVIERLAYDPFGKRRFTNGNFDPTGSIDAQSTNRGFTGHEHLDELDFIHMNARVYDPDIGRFLSPDPTVAHPNNPQSFNRYAYAYNNPLNATDPTGFTTEGVDQSNLSTDTPAKSDTPAEPSNKDAQGTSLSANDPKGGKSTTAQAGIAPAAAIPTGNVAAPAPTSPAKTGLWGAFLGMLSKIDGFKTSLGPSPYAGAKAAVFGIGMVTKSMTMTETAA